MQPIVEKEEDEGRANAQNAARMQGRSAMKCTCGESRLARETQGLIRAAS